ncbi:YhgE/Pip family protein [Neobacillus sp. D3-1R]|uniref:YhgE/Pip domain-containing protein n=1 Tax=Neobacillus sp. D3-1R TaxID=3445778 RepID=UPI003FA04598
MFSWIKSEWASIFKKWKLLVAIFVILFVPSLYSGTYLLANWDPYSHLERLPVAVVNEDVEVQYQGTTYAIGDELVTQLKQDKSFQWQFVSKEEADKGLKNNQYYFEIYIPREFSKRATTLTTQHPTPLDLYYKVNVGSNFIASQIGRTGVDKIRTKLSQQLSKNYAEALFDQITTVGNGLTEASKGAEQLTAGTNKLSLGTQEIIDGMKMQSNPLSQLSSGSKKLSGAASELSKGADQIQAGASQMNRGVRSLETGLSKLNTSSGQLESSMMQLSSGSKQLSQALEGYSKANPELENDPTFQELVKSSQNLSGGLDQFYSNFTAFGQGIHQSYQGVQSLSSGTQTITTKLGNLSDGAKKIADSQTTLSNGTANVYNGWNAVIGHLNSLKNGEERLSSGSQRLADQLASGAKEIQSIHPGQPIYEMMSNPVRLKEQLVHSVPNYGTGLAPYFLSLSLFVGALLLTTVLPLKDTISKPPSALAWYLSKFLLLALISVGHSLITNVFLIHMVGLDPLNKSYLYLFTFFSSLIFMSVILFLVILLDNAGRFMAIILLVLQLTSSAGTFPIELTPPFFQTIHSLLPMWYTVQGFRTIISTGDYHLLQSDVMALTVYLVLSILLTIITLRFMHKKTLTTL